MLITDYYYLISTDSTNRYQELRKFAEKIKLDMETMGNSNGILYFPVYNAEPTYKLMKAGTYFVSRSIIKEFIATGTIKEPPELTTNYGWYAHNQFAEFLLREITEYFGFKVPKHGIHLKKLHFLWTHAFHKDHDDNTINLKIDKYHPRGILWFVENGKINEVEIPEKFKIKIDEYARPISHLFAKKRR